MPTHRHPSVRRFLLTGEPDRSLALNAFNAGMIHYYLKKDECAADAIVEAVKKLRWHYFLTLSASVLQHQNAVRMPWLSDPIFFEIFENFLKKKYY